jgi:hypothetical protein
MAEQQVDDQNIEEVKEEVKQEEQTVKYATYDKAMNTAAKRGQEIEDLKKQLADVQKVNLESSKNIDPTKYQESLEQQNEDLRQRYADLEVTFKSTIEQRDKQDLDRTKLSAVWDVARKAGMVDDRDLLNFIDKEVIQVDENGVVNIKSVNTVVNNLKVKKPFFFAEPKAEKINDKAPDGTDDNDISKLSFSQQLARKQNN